jgi:PucR family transcriptional regulator, purine catabolism regulatory protein
VLPGPVPGRPGGGPEAVRIGPVRSGEQVGEHTTEPNRWSVHDVLASPSLSGARVLAGTSGLGRSVERLNVMEVPDILPWTTPRELLLTTGYPLRDRVGTLADLVMALDDAGLSGLGIKRGRYLGALPDDVIRCADERGFPILELPEDLRFDDVLHEVLTGMLEEQYRQVARSEQLHRTFLDLVVAGRGLHDISAGLSQLVGLPTAIVDLAGTVLAASGIERLGLAREERLTLPPGGRGPLEGTSLHVVCTPVAAGRRQHGWVVALSDEPPDVDLIALQHAATVTALSVAQAGELRAVEEKYRTDLMHDLLTGTDDAREALRRARGFGWDLERDLIVLVARPDGATTGSDPIDLAVRPSVHRRDPGAAIVGFSRQIVIVTTPFTSEQGRSEAIAFASDLAGTAGRRLGTSVSVGLARPVAGVDSIPAAYEQARQALLLGQRIGGPGAVTHFDELGVDRLLAQVPADELRSFAIEVLGPLAADDLGATDLRRTLRALLGAGGNVAEASRRLHFHYNTLRYRIEKLRSALGGFTEDSRIRLDVEVALRVMEMAGMPDAPDGSETDAET